MEDNLEKYCKWTTICIIFPMFLEKELCMGKFCIPNFFLSKALNSKFTPKFIYQISKIFLKTSNYALVVYERRTNSNQSCSCKNVDINSFVTSGKKVLSRVTRWQIIKVELEKLTSPAYMTETNWIFVKAICFSCYYNFYSTIFQIIQK